MHVPNPRLRWHQDFPIEFQIFEFNLNIIGKILLSFKFIHMGIVRSVTVDPHLGPFMQLLILPRGRALLNHVSSFERTVQNHMLLLKCQWKVDRWHEDLQAVVLRSVFCYQWRSGGWQQGRYLGCWRVSESRPLQIFLGREFFLRELRRDLWSWREAFRELLDWFGGYSEALYLSWEIQSI